jgi:hypothetical protein
MGLKPGAPISVLRVGRGLILLPKQTRFERLCDRIAATLAGLGVTESDLQATLPEARRRVVARRYPGVLDAPPAKGKAKRGSSSTATAGRCKPSRRVLPPRV